MNWTEVSNWTEMKEKKPEEGFTAVVLIKETNTMEVATYCDSMWFQLSYDNHLGILRKMPVRGTVLAYHSIID